MKELSLWFFRTAENVRSPGVASSVDGASHAPEQEHDQPDQHEQRPDRRQERDVRDVAEEGKDDTGDEQGGGLPWWAWREIGRAEITRPDVGCGVPHGIVARLSRILTGAASRESLVARSRFSQVDRAILSLSSEHFSAVTTLSRKRSIGAGWTSLGG